MEAAALIRSCRTRRGLSLRELAARARTSHSTLAAYEAGRKVSGADTLARILRATGHDLTLAPTRSISRRTDAPAARSSRRSSPWPISSRPGTHPPSTRRFSASDDRAREQDRRIHDALDAGRIPHAFGGALALAWCTLRPRGTSDIDLNVFVDATDLDRLLASLPPEESTAEAQRNLLERDGQARLFWDATPIDVFLTTTNFHREAALRVQWQEFAGRSLPFLGCSDLAVFKAFFNRTKDWADLEEMLDAGSLDRIRVLGTLVTYLGGADPRVERLRRLSPPVGEPPASLS